MSTHCWLDCDPGHDDAFAILLAAYSEKIKLIGLSTVSGNQTIEKTTKNALNVLNLIGLLKEQKSENDSEKLIDFPIIQGAGKPLMRPGVICDEIHGESGLETHSSIKFPDLPEFAQKYVNEFNSQRPHYTTLMYEFIKQSSVPVTIIATGPLTNIALLLVNHPDCVQNIEKIVLMGGAIGHGNTGPSAEFNIQVDPEAASIVFESELTIYMVPLEVTHTALVTDQILDSINSLSSKFSTIITELLLFFKSTYKTVFRMADPPLHDPCAVAFVVRPELFDYRLMRVDIETASPLSYGQTVCDVFDMSKKKKNVHVCLKMEVDKFWEMMIEAVHLADAKTPIN